jgi:hypothetical protein
MIVVRSGRQIGYLQRQAFGPPVELSAATTGTIRSDRRSLTGSSSKLRERKMPIILWLLGVPLIVVVALLVAHII